MTAIALRFGGQQIPVSSPVDTNADLLAWSFATHADALEFSSLIRVSGATTTLQNYEGDNEYPWLVLAREWIPRSAVRW